MTIDPRDARPHDDAREDGGELILHAQEVSIRTERVGSRRVTLRKRVVEEEQTLTVTVRREEVEVVEEPLEASGGSEGRGEDLPLFAEVTGDELTAPVGTTRADLASFDDGDVELVLYAERPVVTMEVVAVERVRLSKDVVRTDETVTVDLAREEAVAELDSPHHDPSADLGDEYRR